MWISGTGSQQATGLEHAQRLAYCGSAHRELAHQFALAGQSFPRSQGATLDGLFDLFDDAFVRTDGSDRLEDRFAHHGPLIGTIDQNAGGLAICIAYWSDQCTSSGGFSL